MYFSVFGVLRVGECEKYLCSLTGREGPARVSLRRPARLSRRLRPHQLPLLQPGGDRERGEGIPLN